MNYKLEICIDCIESAQNAQIAGADRVELCANLPEGGTTPSYGTIISVRNNLDIGVHVIIRPRGGDFLYSDPEYDIMRRDIDACGECGVNGIVTGILNRDGTIDVDRTARLVEFAYPLPVTFHRAFDMCNDPAKGLEDVIAAGAKRLLTSGQAINADEGTELIRKLADQSKGRIKIMPGSGIDEDNIARVAMKTGAVEFHLSGRKPIESEMIYRQQGVSMSGNINSNEYSRKVTDTEKIKRIIQILRAI